MNRILILFLIVVPLVGRCFADEPATQPSTQPSTFRDPTEAAPDLQEAISAGPAGNHALPQIMLRGLVLVDGKPPMALIEVQNEGLVCVHEGSLITADKNVLAVVAIGQDQIQMQVLATRQTLIVQ